MSVCFGRNLVGRSVRVQEKGVTLRDSRERFPMGGGVGTDGCIRIGRIAPTALDPLLQHWQWSLTQEEEARHAPMHPGSEKLLAMLFRAETGIDDDSLPFPQQCFRSVQAFRIHSPIPGWGVDTSPFNMSLLPRTP
jgi:hypothetical protein